MVKFIVFFGLVCSGVPAWPAACGDQLSAWVLSAGDKSRLVSKLKEHSGSGEERKFFGDIEHGGNRGVHAYIIPDARVAEVFAVGATLRGGAVIRTIAENFDPTTQKLIGVLETEDEPLLSLVLFTKTQTLMVRHHLNYTDGELPTVRTLVPQAWDSNGYYNGFVVLHHLLHDAEEVQFPIENEPAREHWSIESYGPDQP